MNFHSRYPEPFCGQEDENIFGFIKDVEDAFYYNQVPASSRVNVLKRLMKDDAKYAVCETKSLDEYFQYLKWLFGNPRTIWKKEKESFLKMLHKERRSWTNHFSLQRRKLLVKVCGFLKRAENLVKEFESLNGQVFSDSTVNSIFGILPQNIFQKIIKKIRKSKTRDNCNFLNSVEIFKIIQEVLNEVIELKIEASKYYDVLTENVQICEENSFEATESSYESDEEISDNKDVEQEERSKMRVMKSLRYHRCRIRRNARQGKKVGKAIQKYLSKSRQVLVRYKDSIAEDYASIIQIKMVEMEALKDKMKAPKTKTLDYKSVNLDTKEILTKKSYTLDEYIEEVDDFKLPEVPIEMHESEKIELVNIDEEIEKRLIKLKFFNQTWLKDVSKTESKKTNTEVSSADNVVEETDD